MISTKKYIRNNKVILLSIIVVIGFMLRMWALFIPFIGRHGWNEALYASIVVDFIKNKRTYPYIVQFSRPDFNVGPLLYYIDAPFIILFGIREWAFRLPVLIFSIINIILIYIIAKEYYNNGRIALLSSLLYAILPLTTYYGVRFQHEELMFTLYLLSNIFLIKYINTCIDRYIYMGFFFFGVSVFFVKQTFIPFLILFLIVIIYMNINNLKNIIFKTICAIIFFLIPLILVLTLMTISVPRLDPYKFYLNRIFCGIVCRVRHYGAPPGSGQIGIVDVNIRLFDNFILAFGYAGIIMLISFMIAIRYISCKIKRIYLLLSLLIGIISVYLMRYHIIIHEYYFYLLVLPLVLSGSSILDKIINTFETRVRYNGVLLTIIVILVIISSMIPSYLKYHNYRDGFANIAAVKTGYFIRSITNDGDVVLVQSPVMGFYAMRPNIHWGYIWYLDLARLHRLHILECKPILEVVSIYDKNVDVYKLLELFMYWDPVVVVVSPDVSGVLIKYHDKFKPFLDYFYSHYRKIKVIKPYTIFIRKVSK